MHLCVLPNTAIICACKLYANIIIITCISPSLTLSSSLCKFILVLRLLCFTSCSWYIQVRWNFCTCFCSWNKLNWKIEWVKLPRHPLQPDVSRSECMKMYQWLHTCLARTPLHQRCLGAFSAWAQYRAVLICMSRPDPKTAQISLFIVIPSSLSNK